MTQPDDPANLVATALPTGAHLTAVDEHYRYRMHEVLDELRELAPVYRDDVFDHWVITSHDAVDKVFHDSRRCGRDWRAVRERVLGLKVTSPNETLGMVDLDGEAHRRLRGLVSKSFTASAISALTPQLERIADQLINKLAAKESFDFIAEFAAPFSVATMAAILGTEEQDAANFARWSNQWAHVCDPHLLPHMSEVAEAARVSLENYFDAAVKARLAEPKDDLISRLLHGVEGSQRLTCHEVATMCRQLMVAGNLTSADVLGNGLVALLQNPRELEKLRANPALIDQAIEEVLRFDCPVTEIPRFCYEDVEIAGAPIPKGQTLTLNLAASNHDPTAYVSPHEFLIERNEQGHHSFGGGAHHCLGVHLGRLELQVAFRKFLAAFPVLNLADEMLERKAVPSFSGYKTVRVSR